MPRVSQHHEGSLDGSSPTRRFRFTRWLWWKRLTCSPRAADARGSACGCRHVGIDWIGRHRITGSDRDLPQDRHRRSGNDFAVGAVRLATDALELSSSRLSASDDSLVRLMRLLGPAVFIRVGGGNVNFSWWTSSNEAPPAWATSTITPADLSTLHSLR